MSDPKVNSIELSTGSYVPLSFDLESGTPIEILLTGTNLQGLQNVQLDSGPFVSWYITGVTTSQNSVLITAYANGEPGSGHVSAVVNMRPIATTVVDEFMLPLLD